MSIRVLSYLFESVISVNAIHICRYHPDDLLALLFSAVDSTIGVLCCNDFSADSGVHQVAEF